MGVSFSQKEMHKGREERECSPSALVCRAEIS